MKKSIVFLFGLFFLFSSKVNADCIRNMKSPAIPYNGNWVSTWTNSYKTSYSSCLAEHIKVYFTDGFGSPSNNMRVEAILMEDDVAPNEDDPVARYWGIGHTGASMEWQKAGILDYGNLDSAGDQTCELYIKFRFNPNFGSSTTGSIEEGWFRYSICVD